METHRNSPSSGHSSFQTSAPGSGVSHGSATSRLTSEDVKAYLMATEDGQGMTGQPAACDADHLPAHFKPRSELSPTPPPPSSPPVADSAAVVTASATSASASPSPSCTSSSAPSTASVTIVSSPQSLVLVPGSPPQTHRTAHDNTLPAAAPSRLAKLRQNNLAKKREQMKTMKMPELSEHAESSSDSEFLPASNGAPPQTSSPTATSPALANSTSPSAGDNDDSSRVDSSSSGGDVGDKVIRPPSPTEDPVTPSIPDSFLKKLGLSSGGEKKEMVNGGDPSVDQLPDKQLESRFNSLALAFKTDRLTLDKRLGIQERSRDIAEQNIDKELQGLRDAVEVLKQICPDEQVQGVIGRIQRHLDILEHSVARVSSRAEVFGAVQQEKRMCLAMEVMITYTENIRRLRSTEQSEVEEARRVLNSSRQIGTNFSLDTLSIGDRRSASVCAALSNPRTARRRSEVALPRFFGGSGSPSLHVSSSMESGFLSELSQSSLGFIPKPSFADSTEEPKQRFQSATANVTVRNVVTNTLRRASMERQKSLASVAASFSCSNQSATSSSPEKSPEPVKKQHSQEEEAYRHGYEEGLKASLSRELTDLRDQQTTISSSLEQVMDRVESFQHEDDDHAEIDEAMSKVKDAVVKVRLWMSNPNWQSASQTLRKVVAGFIFLLALGIIVVTFAPLIPANFSLRNYAKSSQ